MAKKRPKEHIKAQRETVKMEGGVCLVCGAGKAQGHHLVYYSEGGPADVQAMVGLCPKCHADYHAGRLKVDIDRF
ncbi:MAG: hypothetical protein OHK0047_32440 [Leptolyngbyaceae cyanobacterium]